MAPKKPLQKLNPKVTVEGQEKLARPPFWEPSWVSPWKASATQSGLAYFQDPSAHLLSLSFPLT